MPQDCLICAGASGNALICTGCRDELPEVGPACPICALPSPGGARCGACIATPPSFDVSIAVVRYTHPVDRLVQALKYHHQLPLAAAFAGLIVAQVNPANPANPPRDIDLIVPMPLGRERLRSRGFNQALEIARRVGAALCLPVAASALKRIRETAPQTDLPNDARAKNVRDAFAASTEIMGRRVAVIDDVMTTGASLEELARTLKRAGALRVENWVLARAFKD